MPGILWFLFWQSLGCAISFRFFRSRALLVRLWLGSTAGSVLSMWAPVPFAFLWGFSVPAHAAAAVVGALLAAWLFLAKRASREEPGTGFTEEDRPLVWLLPPFFALWVFLLVTHTLRCPTRGSSILFCATVSLPVFIFSILPSDGLI